MLVLPAQWLLRMERTVLLHVPIRMDENGSISPAKRRRRKRRNEGVLANPAMKPTSHPVSSHRRISMLDRLSIRSLSVLTKYLVSHTVANVPFASRADSTSGLYLYGNVSLTKSNSSLQTKLIPLRAEDDCDSYKSAPTSTVSSQITTSKWIALTWRLS
jgi:hypothetical protein